MNLTATTHTLELVTTTTAATTYAVSWLDVDKSGASTVATPGSAQGTVSSATDTTIVSAPGASVYRTIMSLSIVAAGAQVVSVQKDVSGTEYPISRGTLAVNESLNYEDGNGWYVLNADGSRKGVGADGAAGTNGGGTILGYGTSIIDFGSGAPMATVTVTGETAILAGSLVYCWIKPEATVDHSADEHIVESIKVVASDIVAGTGFTIYGLCPDPAIAPQAQIQSLLGRSSGTGASIGGGTPAVAAKSPLNKTAMLHGKWTVGWFYTQ